MDGEKSSWAKSKDSVKETIKAPVDNGKELVIFELHMSAYGNSDAIREGQIRMLSEDMQKEYEAGNYVICGGDFNHDLKAADTQSAESKESDEANESSDTQADTDDSEEAEPESWAYPFPRPELPEHFPSVWISCPKMKKDLWNSARNADMEYVPVRRIP